MGSMYMVTCGDCGESSEICSGGGMRSHLLRCDTCGQEKFLGFEDLGELHARYLKGLPGPYSIATAEADQRAKDECDGTPLAEDEYHAEIERAHDRSGSVERRCTEHFRTSVPIQVSQVTGRSEVILVRTRGRYDARCVRRGA